MRPGCFSMLVGGLYAVFMVQFQQDALIRLGLTPFLAGLLVTATVVGGLIDLPCYFRFLDQVLSTQGPVVFGLSRAWPVFWRRPRVQWVAVNVGGFLIPLCLSLTALIQLGGLGVAWWPVFLIWVTVVAVSHWSARVVPGQGVVMRPLWPGLISAFLATWLLPDVAPLVAYPCGVLGVLVGADLVNLPAILRQGAPFVSIGGAGTFDGIVITGIFACLLSGP